VNDVIYKHLSLSMLWDWQQGGRSRTRRFPCMTAMACARRRHPRRPGPLRLCNIWSVAAPFVQATTFVKLREASIALDLPSAGPVWFGARDARVSVTGRNLLLFTNYFGYDPEESNFGQQAVTRNIDLGPYPPMRSFFFSITAGFLTMTKTLHLRRLAAVAAGPGRFVSGDACSSFFDVRIPTSQTSRTCCKTRRGQSSGAATGLFAGLERIFKDSFGALVARAGGNQPLGQQPAGLPWSRTFSLKPCGQRVRRRTVGGRYTHIRNINIYLAALAKVGTGEVSDPEKAASRAVANTLKALAFMYVIETRDSLGAPVDVDLPITAPLGLFVNRDSVYRYITGLLDSAQADLGRAVATPFPFPIPSGFGSSNTPGTFVAVNSCARC